MLLKNKSLKDKLLVIILATSGICVVLTTMTIILFGIINLREKMKVDLSSTARLKSDRIAAFAQSSANPDYRELAYNILDAASSKKEMMLCVYADKYGLGASDKPEDYSEFTRVARRDMGKKPCPPIEELMANNLKTFFSDNSLKSYQSVSYKGTKVGLLYVQSDLDEIRSFVREQLLTALIVMAAVSGLSVLLANRLQRSISEPILKLVETTRKVSSERDYSLRAENFLGEGEVKRNEISILIDAFNHMLNEMEERRKLLLRKNQELVKAKEVAESANRAKSQFLANISHELRTPLNAVIGFSDIIYKEMLGPIENHKYIEYSKDINESGEHLLHIINDILDLSKAEAGKLEPVLREISVAKSIKECIAFVAKRAEDNLIDIEANIPDNLPNLVVDRVMFKRIMANLLSNALKFSNTGGKITITVDTQLSNRNDNIFTISIQDTGIGMSKDDVELAFKSFVQLDGGLNRKYEGTGLGLPLTKKLVELHGGSIELKSKVGEGTIAIIKFNSPVNIG